MRCSGRMHGFSLLEAMVTIALILIVSIMTTPISSKWANDAVLINVASQTQQSYIRARKIAISNPDAVMTGEVASVLCVTQGVLYVQRGKQGKCGENYEWSTKLSSGVSLSILNATARITTTDFTCIALDSLGLPIEASLDHQQCTVITELNIARGGANGALELY